MSSIKQKKYHEEFNKIKNIYTNLLLVAIEHRIDFWDAVEEASEKVSAVLSEYSDQPYPEGFVGLLFLDFISEIIGTSFNEAATLSEQRKKTILYRALRRVKPKSLLCDYFSETEKFTYITGHMPVLKVFDVEQIRSLLNEKDEDREFFGDDDFLDYDLYTQYLISFAKQISLENEFVYTVVIESSIADPKYTPHAFILWEGTDGILVDFIEEIIKECQRKANKIEAKKDRETDSTEAPKADSKKDSLLSAETSSDNYTTSSIKVNKTSILVEKPIIETHLKDKNSDEELITSISNDTKTIELLDRFEGYGTQNPKQYKRIIIQDGNILLNSRKTAYFHLVIERGRGSIYEGDITFTAFKTGKTKDLYDYVRSEITSSIVENFIDTDKFFTFSKPYLLRAQNSKNRENYGWEWDWSNGYGDYTAGTFYGETTNYFFVGVYISSGYTYNPYNRKRFKNISYTQNNIEKPTTITVLKFGGRCPACGGNSHKRKNIQVIDQKGETCEVNVFECNCGQVYMTRNMSKSAPSTLSLKYVEGKNMDISFSTKISKDKSKLVICPKCRHQVSNLFSSSGMCWECYKYMMSQE